MADSSEAKELNWHDPKIRAIIPIDHRFHVPHRLARTIRKRPYRITLNQSFKEVMGACASSSDDRPVTWINAEIIALYTALNERGHAHSIEVWNGNDLVGGLYGVSLGGAFFGESMFSRRRDASKIALVYLVAALRDCGFALLDTQFQTKHLMQFGTVEISRNGYHILLEDALNTTVKSLYDFDQSKWSAGIK